MDTSTTPISAGQLVAHNVRRLRGSRTQEEAAALLEPYTRVRLSKRSWSNAERSADPELAREGSYRELLALAAAFQVPVGEFFRPVNDGKQTLVFCSARLDDGPKLIHDGALIQAMAGSDVFNKSLARTLRGVAAALDPTQED